MNPIVDPDDFPATHNCTYLNAANVALMYRGAEKAIVDWQKDVAENGSMNFDETAEANVFDELHVVAARLFKARLEDIAVGSSATELLSSLAWAVAPGSDKNVVSTNIVFPSTIYPWRRVANHTGCQIRFALGQNGYANPDDIIQLIDKNTAVVCISHVEYGGGQRFDLAKLGEAAHEHGALFVVDATQSAGAIPIDAPGCAIDALVCGAYKWLCGPFGAAVMYLAPHLQTELEPGLVGFRSHKDMWDLQADRIEYPKTAKRFEFSTMAFGCALGLARSIEFLLNVGIKRIFKYNLYLADGLIHGLHERNVEITSPLNNAERTSIVTARFHGQDSDEIARKLKEAQVIVSSRHDIIRFSPHLYNNSDDIVRSLECIDQIYERSQCV
ncbi:MAG: aminotransferase class V-fold PLP-dependent enzyme [bacterium]